MRESLWRQFFVEGPLGQLEQEAAKQIRQNHKGGVRHNCPATSVVEGVGGGGEKTKNSTNRERGTISKAMDRMAESIESGGGGTVGVI